MNNSFLFRDVSVGKLFIGVLIVVGVFVGWSMWPDKHLGNEYYVNKNGQVYLKGDGFVYGDDILVGVDAKTFAIIQSNTYIRDKDAVFAVLRNGANRWVSRVNGADVSSFIGASGFFGKDRSRVFFEDRIVEGADPSTFVVLSSELEDISGDYAKDKLHSFYQDRAISDRPKLLRLILSPHTGYFSSQGTTGLFYFYATDDEQVFLNGDEIHGADPRTFEAPFRGVPELARDSRSIYFNGTKIEGVDLKSFVILYGDSALDTQYAKDHNHVYFFGYDYASNLCVKKPCVVGIADPKTFSLGGGSWYDAKDATNYFLDGAVVGKNEISN